MAFAQQPKCNPVKTETAIIGGTEIVTRPKCVPEKTAPSATPRPKPTPTAPISNPVVSDNTPAPVNAPAQAGPMPDRWRGLILDQSTPADATRILGTPKSDKQDSIRVFNVPKQWLTKRTGESVFQVMKWDKLEAMDSAELAFLNGRLVLVRLDPKEQPAAAALGNIYGIQVSPIISGIDEAVSPYNYERNQGRVYPKIYPSVYKLVGVAERSIVAGLATNVGFGSALRQTAGVSDGPAFPGKIKQIELVSRALENRDGSDALK